MIVRCGLHKIWGYEGWRLIVCKLVQFSSALHPGIVARQQAASGQDHASERTGMGPMGPDHGGIV